MPFVGRATELSLLCDRAREARSGLPGLVVVEGEPGIGKSSLLREAIERLGAKRTAFVTVEPRDNVDSFALARRLSSNSGHLDEVAHAGTRRRGEMEPVPAQRLRDLLSRRDVGAGGLALVVIDDVDWADRASAQVLLAALRRLRDEPVLALVSARPGRLARLGEEWPTFAFGDPRAGRIRLGGLDRGEVVTLGAALGAGTLPSWAAARLVDHTGGNPLHCCALFEELEPEAWTRPGRLPAPRALATVVLARVAALSPDAGRLVSAAAVLGRQSRVEIAASVAELDDPLPALEEAAAAGLLEYIDGGPAAEIAFTHALIHCAVYKDLRPTTRRQLHRAAVVRLDPDEALTHRLAAAHGCDERLASDLETAAARAAGHARRVQAAHWLTKAAVASPTATERSRRALDGVEILLSAGEVTAAEALLAEVGRLPETGRLLGLRGEIELISGRTRAARSLLTAAWNAHDRRVEPLVGARIAMLVAVLCTLECAAEDAIEWSQRAVHSAADVRQGQLARALRAMLHVVCRGETPAPDAGPLVPAARRRRDHENAVAVMCCGLTELLAGQLDDAIANLTTATRTLQADGQTGNVARALCWLGEAVFWRGAWSEASANAELALELAASTGSLGDICLAHSCAARVLSARGELEAATRHLQSAQHAAQSLDLPLVDAVCVSAAVMLAEARGRPEEILAAVRSPRVPLDLGLGWRRSSFDWRPALVDALIAVGELGEAALLLQEIERELGSGVPVHRRLTTRRLRGNLAAAQGRHEQAGNAFGEARRDARELAMPFVIARLELDDARRLVAEGSRDRAIARLRVAHAMFAGLGAKPYCSACEHELATCGLAPGESDSPLELGLTRSEAAVARLAATGLTNREIADRLFVSVKTVEFHLRHVFAKLEIRSRKELHTRLEMIPA
jgi:DNA-binding CsgD family transcriptional regulator/tetratricopeptide (TPR) repeat protein